MNSREEVPRVLLNSIIVGRTISDAINNLAASETGRAEPLDLI
jgi:hypothetical protein